MSLNKENQILERIPPHSLEAEESLLGCLLTDKDAIIKVADTVLPQDFYKEVHQNNFWGYQRALRQPRIHWYYYRL